MDSRIIVLAAKVVVGAAGAFIMLQGTPSSAALYGDLTVQQAAELLKASRDSS